MSALPEISPDQLNRLIGTPEAPTVIDVRTAEDFANDPRLIPTARKLAHGAVLDALPSLDLEHVVVVCHRGLKLSQGAAALLRCEGVEAEWLTGGMLAWQEAGHPLIAAEKLPTGGLWVTRHRPKIDRIACPWLIRRFVDSQARFLFVSPGEVLNVADRFGATPFDVEGVTLSHRGDNCTFDAMLEDWDLKTEPLERLAKVIRAADTNTHKLAPEAAGLLAISVGLSRLYRDDLEQLEAGMVLYDALYRWARDGFEETHDWPASGKP